MTELLVRLFVKDHEQIEKVSVRTAYGTLASMVGIFCNVFLVIVKGTIGILMNSVSVTADAINNLADAVSSVIGLIGVKMAAKPADEEHPFGHGRIEYVTALIVSFIVIELGLTFFKDSLVKIKNPEEMRVQLIAIPLLLFAVVVKLWIGAFNRKLGKKIDSKVMLATAADSIGDVLMTCVTIVSILFFYFTGMNIDGCMGLIVAVGVMWAGIGIAKDTLEPLIGQAVEPEVYEKITGFVEGYEGIVGSHDLIVHNYGPGRSIASIHAEVPNDEDINVSHEIIDRIEKEAVEQLGMVLVIHMDPIETKDEIVLAAKRKTVEMVNQVDEELSLHDFRVVVGEKRANLIFDLVVPHQYDKQKEKQVCTEIKDKLQDFDDRLYCVIKVEKSYIAGKKE